MLPAGRTYEEICQSFKWEIPKYYNIGVDICDKWARQPTRLALIYENPDRGVERYTFRDLAKLSNRFANGLVAHGVKRGDRVALLLPQCPETAISHIAVYKIGAIALPLFTLFGVDALEYRLSNCGAKAIVTDRENLPKIMEISGKLRDLEIVIVVGGEGLSRVLDFQDLIEGGSTRFEPFNSRADDPALIIYTSRTTGPPKGALHTHRVLLGHLPGVEFPHCFSPQAGDLFWTPADWAWIGGLIDVLLPSWHHGVPVLARRAMKFDPEEAFRLIAKHRVRNLFMPPTALKMMRQVQDPARRYDYDVRTIGSGGESLGEDLLEWGRETFSVTINEFYGQTEVNLVIGSCSEAMTPKPGSMGRAIPGHNVEVVDEDGNPVAPREVGEIAVKRPDPVMFLEYWQDPESTEAKFIGDWCLTGDLAKRDEDGYFWFEGRKDDLITSSGYRIGPTEIEECLMKHPSVAMAAVIGRPDDVRTEVVKAFIVPKPGVTPDDALKIEIVRFVKRRLAAYQYPREIEFTDELPMTATGKIMRGVLKNRETQ